MEPQPRKRSNQTADDDERRQGECLDIRAGPRTPAVRIGTRRACRRIIAPSHVLPPAPQRKMLHAFHDDEASPDQALRNAILKEVLKSARGAGPRTLHKTRPGPDDCRTVPFCNISGDPKCLSSPPTRRRAVALALNRPGVPVGDKENGPFQFTFNGLLKVAFQGSHITSDAGLILVRELNERLGLEHRITDHLSDSRHGTNTQFRVADLLRQSVYSRLAGYEDLNDAVGAFSEERWRRKSTGMERCPRNAVEPRRFLSIPRRGVYRCCVPGAGRSATKKLVATGARWGSIGLFWTAKMEIPA